jgi:hypothetical protein
MTYLLKEACCHAVRIQTTAVYSEALQQAFQRLHTIKVALECSHQHNESRKHRCPAVVVAKHKDRTRSVVLVEER